MNSGQDWHRLADHVIARRVALGMRDRRQLAKATGVTDRTLGVLERGGRVSASTLGAIELALQWAPGSARRILAGGEPDSAAPAATGPRYDDPALQSIWENQELSEAERLGAIALIQRMRAAAAAGRQPA